MFSVEKIINEIVILENLNTCEKVEVSREILQDIKESDIVIFENGTYTYSEEETLKRKNKIEILKSKLKVLNKD